MARLAANGKPEWQRTFGGPGRDPLKAAASGRRGQIFLAGVVGAGSADPKTWIVALNGAGKSLWQRTFDTEGLDVAQVLGATADGGLVVGGWLERYRLWFVRLDAAGNTVWHRAFKPEGYVEPYKMIVAPDSTFVVVGSSTDRSGQADAWLLIVDPNGRVIRSRTYGGSRHDLFKDALWNGEGDLVLVGKTSSFGRGHQDAWVVALSPAGGISWQYAIGGPRSDGAEAVAALPDGDLLLAGSSSSFGQGLDDAWVVRFRPEDGGIVWQQTIGSCASDHVDGLALLPSRCSIVLTGSSFAKTASERAAWLVRTGLGRPRRSICGDYASAASSASVTKTNSFITSLWSPPEHPWRFESARTRLEGKNLDAAPDIARCTSTKAAARNH
ncbi:MAG: hypothetical protein R6V84_05785 [Desulfobacterales bacterium]